MLVTPRRRVDCAGVACEHTLGRQPLHLYGYLWAKPEFLIDDQSGRFSFVVPDTVLFKQQKPVKWFFTSRQDKGQILTKSKKSLHVTHVLQAFLEPKHKVTSPSDCRKHSTPADTDNAIVATYVYPDRSSNGESVMVVEHLTANDLHHLLIEREKPPISVLQRFVPTRSGYNHLIQSVFTPESCQLRKCVNSNLVSDAKRCLPERTATFEADERLVKPRNVTNREIREQIEHMHLEMSNHLKKIIGKPVARNVAYFKHGADDRVYLLWSTMLSFETGTLAFAKNMRLSLSHQDRLQQLIATTSSSQTENNHLSTASTSSTHAQAKRCPACRSIFPHTLVDFVVTFKAIINAYEGGSDHSTTSTIPPLLASLLPPTSDERFKELVSNKQFLYRTVALCQPCAKHINDSKKLKVIKSSDVKSSPQPTKARSDRDQPIYMQSAHSIFWGKFEREQAERDKSEREQCLQSRSIPTRSSRRSLFVSRTCVLPNGLTRASLKRLLPDLAVRSGSVTVGQPKHCMETLTAYLNRTFGGPSVRVALASTNTYPLTSQISIELLRQIVKPQLLADVVTYWNAVSKAHNVDVIPGSIDLDSLDAMLRAHSDDVRLSHQQHKDPMSGSHDTVDPSISKRVFTPMPPGVCRPSSCAAIRPARNMALRLVHRPISASAVSRSATHPGCTHSNEKPPSDHHFVSVVGQKRTPFVLNRVVNGVKHEIDVSVITEDVGDSLALHIRAFRLEDAIVQSARSNLPVMELTLNTHQLLNLVASYSQSPGGGAQIPPTVDSLVQLVVDGLIIQELHSRSASLACPRGQTGSPSHTNPICHSDSSLTEEELRFLQEMLQS